MKRRAAVLGASLVLAHVPDLVRYGSKPLREPNRSADLQRRLRSFSAALTYPPHQVFLGNLAPEQLWDLDRPWWSARNPGKTVGPFGEFLDQRSYYELMVEADRFGLVGVGEEPDPAAGDLLLTDGLEPFGRFRRAHPSDESLTATILLENLACKASGVHALRALLENTRSDPDTIEYVIGAGEEAIGDRYQRGGGSLSKAIAEQAGLNAATGSDLKAFCAAPIHALVAAAALVESGVFRRVAVVAGGSPAKLGMKFLGALKSGVPILEDVLAGAAVLIGEAPEGPVIRLDAVGRHRVDSGSSQQALLTDIVARPLAIMGRKLTGIERYATELHDPEITEPAGGGDVPDRNYRMIAALGRITGDLEDTDADGFGRRYGLPGFAPTQGHIASAIPWLPHALARMDRGELSTTMLLAKGSLFLGRMTRLWDGISITVEA